MPHFMCFLNWTDQGAKSVKEGAKRYEDAKSLAAGLGGRIVAARVRGSTVRLRQHAKTHKCPVIALKQIELGAVGVCVQKVSEAEAMVYGGVRDVLVTNEIVGRQKLRHLMALAHTARIGVCADDLGQVQALEAAAAEAGITLPVYVEINMGGNRCGVEPGQPALDLARR